MVHVRPVCVGLRGQRAGEQIDSGLVVGSGDLGADMEAAID
jgi:hypothetical protein